MDCWFAWYNPPMKNERNEHFKEFAHLHYPELSQLFFTMYARIEELRPIEEIDVIEDEIKTLIAQRAYDLLFFLIDEAPTDYSSFNAGYGTPNEIHECIEHLPDLDTWPEPPTTVE